MSQFSHRARRQVILAVLTTVVVTCSGAAWAASSTRTDIPVEEGWPQSHLFENDPRPGEPGYPVISPSSRPPDGMTDEQLRTTDPDGYRALAVDRAALEKKLLASVRSTLKSHGITPGRNIGAETAKSADAVLASTTYSPYGYLKFRLVPSTSTYARNGYLGTLYFTYGIYSAATDSYKWYTVSWPARSGNNKPASQSVVGVGPIPEYKWTFGFADGTWYGYQADARASFAPGKWRLDPWTGGPYGRCYMEVHGGINEQEFAATSGCIRLHSKNIPALRSYYDYKMANKKDRSTAKLTVDY